jgi:hypothetical protein
MRIFKFKLIWKKEIKIFNLNLKKYKIKRKKSILGLFFYLFLHKILNYFKKDIFFKI